MTAMAIVIDLILSRLVIGFIAVTVWKGRIKMRIEIDWCLYTDGDYGLRHLDQFDGVLDDDLFISGIKTFDNSMEASRFLEEMLCDIRVGSSHYYVLQCLFNIFDPLIQYVSGCEYKREEYTANDNLCTVRQMGGNYEGTEIKVKITYD